MFSKIKDLINKNRRKKNPYVKNPEGHKKLIRGVIFLLLLLVIGGVGLFLTGNLNIKEVEVNNSLSCASPSEIKNQAKLEGQNIFLINESSYNRVLKSKIVCLEKLEISKKSLQKIELKVFEKPPVLLVNVIKPKERSLDLAPMEATASTQASNLDFAITQDSLGEFLVDKDGLIYGHLQSVLSGVPFFYLEDEKVNIGEFLPNNLVNKVLSIFETLNKEGIALDSLKVSGEKVLVSSNPRLVFSLKKDLNTQFASLQLILQKAKMDSNTIDQIDLRFDKPVVIFSSKKQ
jgi:hypothetical protein